MGDSDRKILVVDDDPGMRDQLKWSFDGFEVVTAKDRVNALEQFNKFNPPVVTLDLGLPPDAEGTMEGFETLNKILDSAPQTKIVIVSGSDKINAKRAIDLGAFCYLSKPVDVLKLAQIIELAYQDYISSRNSMA